MTLLAFPDRAIVERLPFSVRHLGQVGDHRMDMALGIERPARVMLEQGIDEVAGPDRRLLPVYIFAALSKIGFDPSS
ncbi:hypothetical protein EP837_03684 (plasmid) [Sphingobium sp. EP60837]|nr:hypothetical protein EP837_03684 [Sphingobium sp. EP60837]